MAASSAVSDAVVGRISGLLSGCVGVIPLTLHAAEAVLVAGWRQQLTEVAEPGGNLEGRRS